MNVIWTVLKKECVDNIRDRRTILSSFSLALLGPLAFVAMMTFVLNKALGESDTTVEFTLAGADHAPGLVAYLEGQNTEIEQIDLEPGQDPRVLVTSGAHDLLLVVPEDFAERFENGRSNALALIYDSSELGSAQRRARRVDSLVSTYSRTIGLMRLQLRGVDPSIAQPVSTRTVDVASPAERALMVLTTLPYLILLVAFMGGFYLAIDTTAGEREHGSLEPLLTQPVARSQLVLGKIGATAVFALASLCVFLIAFYFSVPFVPLERIGMSLDVDIVAVLMMLGVMLPLVWFAAALLTVAASFAKSYKEAQTYLSFLILVPTLPVIVAQVSGVEASLPLMMVPSLSQSLLVQDLITSEPITLIEVLISAVSTGVLALGLTWLAILLYRRERILI